MRHVHPSSERAGGGAIAIAHQLLCKRPGSPGNCVVNSQHVQGAGQKMAAKKLEMAIAASGRGESRSFLCRSI